MRKLPTPFPASTTNLHGEPNVTPFLDVLLVLLILFMYLTLNQQKVLTAQLPAPPSPTLSAVPIVLEVKPRATYAINREPISSAAGLAARLRQLYASRPDKVILVRGTSGVRYQEVVTAVDIARGAGVSVIGLATSTIRR